MQKLFLLANKKGFFLTHKKNVTVKKKQRMRNFFFWCSKKDNRHKRAEVNSLLNIKSLFYRATNLFRDNKNRQKAYGKCIVRKYSNVFVTKENCPVYIPLVFTCAHFYTRTTTKKNFDFHCYVWNFLFKNQKLLQ